MTLAIRPERVEMFLDAPADGNVFEVTLRNAYYLGPYTEFFLDVGNQTIRAQHSFPIDATPGQRLYARVAPEHCLVVDESLSDVDAT